MFQEMIDPTWNRIALPTFGDFLDMRVIRQLTGNDTIQARSLYPEPNTDDSLIQIPVTTYTGSNVEDRITTRYRQPPSFDIEVHSLEVPFPDSLSITNDLVNPSYLRAVYQLQSKVNSNINKEPRRKKYSRSSAPYKRQVGKVKQLNRKVTFVSKFKKMCR